jgi:hypothetical protein
MGKKVFSVPMSNKVAIILARSIIAEDERRMEKSKRREKLSRKKEFKRLGK